MKTLTHLRAIQACLLADASPTSSAFPSGRRLSRWAGLFMLILVPATILATTGESIAGSCCRGTIVRLATVVVTMVATMTEDCRSEVKDLRLQRSKDG